MAKRQIEEPKPKEEYWSTPQYQTLNSRKPSTPSCMNLARETHEMVEPRKRQREIDGFLKDSRLALHGSIKETSRMFSKTEDWFFCMDQGNL
jgi:hypothetical protein